MKRTRNFYVGVSLVTVVVVLAAVQFMLQTTSGPTHQHHLIDVLRRHTGVLHRLPARSHRLLQ